MDSKALNHYYVERLSENGFRFDDIVEFAPLYGKKKRCKINRTSIDFATEDMLSDCQSAVRFKLDPLFGESLHFRLKMKKMDKLDIFVLDSINGYAFRHNGSLCFQALIEYGDVCHIGHNELIFKKRVEEELLDDSEDPILHGKEKIIESNLPILIEGETGSGKSTLAKRIHEKSGRLGNFVHLNLSAFSRNLLESELFGHEKGSFTGALHSKLGALREANRGTLFLDEIDSLDIDIQTKLLLFLDNQVVRPLGGSDQKIETRLILSSGQKLENLVIQKRMRKDFYYRISCGENIRLLPLREDASRIEYYCKKFAIQEEINITHKLINFYQSLPWPGNIRQLMGHLHLKRVSSSSRKIDFDSLDEQLICSSSNLLNLEESDKILSLRDMRDEYIFKIYFHMNKNVRQTAKTLNISEKLIRGLLNKQRMAS